MNELTRSLIAAILSDEDAWDRGTKRKPKDPPELRYAWVLKQFGIAREHAWIDLVVMPIYRRALHLWRVLTQDEGTRLTHFEEREDGVYLTDCETCQYWFSVMMEDYYHIYWRPNHPEWDMLEPTKEEVLSVAYPPKTKLVADKVIGNAVQVSMF